MIKEFQGKYRWLSNFWWFDGVTVEHLYQASKCLHKEDALKIMNCEFPSEAKRLGKLIEKRKDWEEEGVREGLMLDFLRLKFKNNDLRRRLLATGKKYLQEGNYWGDTFWGVDLRTGKGKNMLGKLIMQVRREIRNEKKNS